VPTAAAKANVAKTHVEERIIDFRFAVPLAQ
jgi:hypothetical protein